MQEESRMISSGSSSSAHKDKGRNSNVARMLKLTASILSISLFVMMMMFWGGGIDDDYDSSTSTFLHRQLSSLEQFMDPKSTNLRTGLQSKDALRVQNRLELVHITKTGGSSVEAAAAKVGVIGESVIFSQLKRLDVCNLILNIIIQLLLKKVEL